MYLSDVDTLRVSCPCNDTCDGETSVAGVSQLSRVHQLTEGMQVVEY